MLKKKISSFTMFLSFFILFSCVSIYAGDLNNEGTPYEMPFQISEEVLPLKKGTSCQLTVSYSSEDAIAHVIWHTTDPDVAAVSGNGIVTAHNNGTATIYAEYDNGIVFKDSCIVRVINNIHKSWAKKDGLWFLYTGSDYLTGWQLVDGSWYYLNSSGIMQTGWQFVNGKWYFLNPSGTMQTGWQFVNGKWYFLKTSGDMATGWLKNNGKWYLLNGSGAMLTDWCQVNGTWYYMSSSGAMLTGWQFVNGKWYYMDSSGAMQTGWQRIGGSWYLLSSFGDMLTGWHKIKDNWYYLQNSGRMATETVTVNGRQEVFHTNGKWISTGTMDTKASGYSSQTNYLILVSLKDKVTKIYRKNGSKWQVEKAWLCTVGDTSKGWGTVTGDFYIGYSSWGNPVKRGYSFNDSEGHTLYYWTRFCDSFLFHSVLYDGGTYHVSQTGNALGAELSHGCVRLRTENAKWIYDHIPDSTRVIVY